VNEAVLQRLLEALARRAEGREGASRQALEDKAARWRTRGAAEAAKAEPAPGAAAPAARDAGLASLVAALQPRTEGAGTEPRSPAPSMKADEPVELKSLQAFRDTWARVQADRQIELSLAREPGQAGPLNSLHLVHRSLKLMREVSPDYLRRFMAHVEALMWLEQLDAGPAGPAPAAPAKANRVAAPQRARRRSPGA
jgi:hypothetical protein